MQGLFPGGNPVQSAALAERTVKLHLPDPGTRAVRQWSLLSLRQRRSLQPLAELQAALPQLRAEGYEVISLSGRGTLLSPWLGEFVNAAKAEGFRTAATLTGGAVTARHRPLLEALDRITVSFDGLDPRHNALRGNSQTRVRAIAALRYLAEIGKPAEAMVTVSRNTLPHVPDLVDLCAALGVRAVRLYPLIETGGATEAGSGLGLGNAERAALRQLVQALAETWAGLVALHVDPTRAEVLAAGAPALDLALQRGQEWRLSDAVTPLIVTPEGRLRAWTEDFPEEFDLGQLQDLAPARRIWIMLGLPRLRRALAHGHQTAAPEEEQAGRVAVASDQVRRAQMVSV